MRLFDLICNDCRHRYRVESESAWVDEEKHCPKCGSDTVHQRFKSYLHNGPLFTEESVRNKRYKGSCCCCSAYGETDADCSEQQECDAPK